ncbi:hypothetical protein AVEN_31077-1 [Araneus ventricosus]|uniref:Helitron helicase-like domain-containing protein n=1 Tax=Araneus ventricosus TaxID=182803 RepID=A0A4Y2MKR8_ARAVE|nr:hypothetical protein AVEN_31077-1 [Araneus ventricosus]
MRERCADAMPIFGKYGALDLFITFTANPKWPEIRENLRPSEHTTDRPDLLVRVFNLKLKSLMEDLAVHGVLGKSIAHVYTIEFQKHGLPHAHILILLRADDKFSTSEHIDKFVCVEIPSSIENPRLHDIVTKCLMHGPCGIETPGAPCMEPIQCKKMFPREFRTEITMNVSGHPLYRRRPGDTAFVRGREMDNRFVVPYNPYLLLKYNAHINVEVCTSLSAVKYVYKYINKGFDCTNMVLTAGQVQDNEIANYIDARYVSAPEAMWRLLGSYMHDRSHAVMRLPVHLRNQKRVTFKDGHEEEALEAARSRQTMLESWFQLNQSDPDAQTLLYTDISYNYVYDRNNWKRRKRGGNKIVARMYVVNIVNIKDAERFYLRMLLLHVPGATSFKFLRTVDNVIFDTFKQAVFHRHLLNSDEEWDHCLHDASTYQMPKQLRQTFAFILYFCNPTNVLELWNKYSIEMSLDYLRNKIEAASWNLALHDINAILEQHGLSCASIGLPVPTGNAIEVQPYNQDEEREEAEQRISSLNREQLAAFETITRAIENNNENDRHFWGMALEVLAKLFSIQQYYLSFGVKETFHFHLQQLA